jgi:hypothetical protein
MRLSVAAFASVLVFAAIACSSKPSLTTTPPASTEEPVGNVGGEGEPSVAPYSCSGDDECVASCAVREQCCDQLCAPCGNAFHVDELAAHEAWKEQACTEQCPVARCKAPTEQGIAHCVDGACTVELVPYTPE